MFCHAPIDLHNHSTASDGTLTPTQLVALARELGLVAIAITDHDTVDGVAEAVIAGQHCNVEVVTGMEISVDALNPDGQPISLHLLGYFIDHENPALNEALRGRRYDRAQRNQHMLDRLNQLGIALTMEQLLEFQPHDNILGRLHFAQAMVAHGWVADQEQAFRQYLARGATAYVHKRRLSQQQGIELIRQAGGVAALAHPAHLLQYRHYFLELLRKLKSYGLQAMEACYGEYSTQQTKNLCSRIF